MSDVSDVIIGLFSDSFRIISKKETCDVFTIEYQVNNISKNFSKTDDWRKTIINSRDLIEVSFFEEEEEDPISYLSNVKNSWNDFIIDLQNSSFQQGKIKIHIEKKFQNNRLSIYDIESFIEYIKSLSLSQFFAIIDNYFVTLLIFEVQDNYFHNWATNSIAFVGKNSLYNLAGIGSVDRVKRINEARSLCYCEIKKYNFLPEDLFNSELDENNPLQLVFATACILYMYSFIFDYSSIKEDIYEYKLNAFKSLKGQLNVVTLPIINVDIKSRDSIYKVYQWLYLGGNNNDKINIVRNIISLNIDKYTFSLNDSVYDSILSNYKIYEKNNVKQYLQVRNELSKILLDLQAKISSIVDSFINDFKKSILTLVSFFISVMVIRVVSKGDFTGGFTNEIIGLSFVFLIISVGLLYYSRWELTKKVDLYDKQYYQLKNRYKDILSEVELEEIFEECDPKKDRSNASFVTKQKKIYSYLWGGSILLLFIFLLVVLFINNTSFHTLKNFIYISIVQVLRVVLVYFS